MVFAMIVKKKMNKTEQILELAVKNDERVKTLFNYITRIENHLEKLNGKVAEHEKFKIQIKSYWIVISVLTPIAITLVLQMI